MKSKSNVLLSLIGSSGIVLLTFLPTAARSQTPSSSDDLAVIYDTGSTNLPGYQIAVSPSGEFEYQYSGNFTNFHGAHQGSGTIPQYLAQDFYNHIETDYSIWNLAAKPGCPLSASFGSDTFVEFKLSRSPNANCSSDDLEIQALNTLVNKITNIVTNDPPGPSTSVPEPYSGLGMVTFGALIAGERLWRKKES